MFPIDSLPPWSQTWIQLISTSLRCFFSRFATLSSSFSSHLKRHLPDTTAHILITSRNGNFLKAASCCKIPWCGGEVIGGGMMEVGGVSRMYRQRPDRLTDASNCFTPMQRLISRWSQGICQIKPSLLLHPNACFLWCFKELWVKSRSPANYCLQVFFLKIMVSFLFQKLWSLQRWPQD